MADELERPLPEQDLARAGRLFEPGRDVHRVTGRQPLAGVSLSGHDLAGVDADPRLDRDAVVALEIAVQHGQPLTHLVRRKNRAERVVLVEHGHAENGHDGVSDELLDRSSVSFENGLHLVEVAAHHTAERFRVELFAERCRPRDSANRTVTVFLTSLGSAPASAVPHSPQNRTSSAFSRPQLGHVGIR